MWLRSRSTGSGCCATRSRTRPRRCLRAGASGARRGGRRYQLDGVLAVPFGGSGNGGDFAALAIDQHRGRHAQGPAYGFKILKSLGFLVAKIAERGQLGVLQKVFWFFGVAGVDVDRHHLEILAAELGLQPIKRRHLLAARHAPGRPKVHEHRLAAPVRKLLRLAVGVVEGKVGQPERRGRHGQRGYFAVGERGDLACKVNRARADRIARCVALEPAKPVYPGESDRGADDDGSDHIGDSARGSRGRRGAFGHIVCHSGSDTAIWKHCYASFRYASYVGRRSDEKYERMVMSNKMWGGRFTERPDAIMEEINVSIDVDRHMYAQDIAASKAHAAMLSAQGIITANDAKNIAKGLDSILSEIGKGSFDFKRALDDIHMIVESRLSELIGPAAGRLHTARSRNDQVATDFRLFVRDTIDETDAALAAFQQALASRALEHAATVMPGFTHLQTAPPVTFGHHLLAYVEMAARDRGRFADARKRLNESPLGAAALAGTSFPIDREMTAKALGFDRATANSLDAVSDRDFVMETLAAAAIASVHLSRLAEEIVIWTSPLVGLVKLSDKITTSSSNKPQKRNPDAAELVRAKT